MGDIIDFNESLRNKKKTINSNSMKTPLIYSLSDLQFSALMFIKNYRNPYNKLNISPTYRATIEIVAALNAVINRDYHADYDFFLCEEPWELDSSYNNTLELKLPLGYEAQVDWLSRNTQQAQQIILSEAVDSYIQAFYDEINGFSKPKHFLTLEQSLEVGWKARDFKMMNILNQLRQKDKNQRLKFLPESSFTTYHVEIRN